MKKPRSNVADEAPASCQRIATVAALLEACGTANEGDVVQSHVVAHAGQMIAEEVKALGSHLTRLAGTASGPA